jgi:DNA-binding response OmpR family regulator
MLVEDDPTMTLLLQTLMEIEGFAVVMADNPAGVIDMIKSEQPDVVVMDVHLHNANGLDILGALRADGNAKHTPVIMSSGLDFHKKAMQGGADAFVQKPYMPDELIGKIKQLLENDDSHG